MADTQTLKSDPFQITSKQLPGLTRSLNFKTVTTFEKDNNNKIIDSSKKTILQYQATPGGIFQAAATSTEGGKAGSWTLINAANSNTPILGQAAINSLQTPKGVLNQETQKSVGIAATKLKLSPEEIKKLSDKTKNEASPTGAGTSPAAGTKIDGDAILKVFEEEKKGTRNNFPKLTYPINLKSEFQDVIKFNMVKYEPKKFQAEKLEFDPRNIAGGTNRQRIGTVTLPIPAGISDMNACNWGGGDMNALEASLGSIADASVQGGGAAASAEFTKLVEGVSKNSAGVKAAVTKMFVEKAVGSTGFFTRTTGLVVNSNLELLFSGPTLRPFNFTFKMSAREDGEAKEIRSIIRFFKQGMSPIRTQSSLFLKTPHTFQIQYRHKNEEHKFLNKFKECALTSFSVNYTPEGQYATYTDGAMVSYEMQMQFTELEPIFNDEYKNSENAKDTEIGY